MKIMRKVLCLCIIATLLPLFSGCVEDGEKTSYTTVLISDAPSENFSHINVTFSQVKIHRSGNDNDSGWISFDIETKTVDMIYLHEQNLSEIIGVQNLSVGNYSKLWIVVDGATGVLKDSGEEIVFDVPSGDLKIQQPFVIEPGNMIIDVEIDLDKSVLYVPQGEIYKLLPVISKVEVNGEGGNNGDDDDDEDEEEELTVDAGDEYDGEIGELIEFEGEAESGVKPYSWNWTFGDGNSSTEQNPIHAYSMEGTYDVFLVVTDAENNTASDDTTVEIMDLSADEMSFTSVFISDAPSDNFSHINVTFSQVKIHKESDDNDSGWILFQSNNSTTVDLIYLHEQNLSEELGVQNLSVGNYTKLWIVIDAAMGVLKETDEEIIFDVPSGDLKIQQPFDIRQGNTTIDVEIDLDRSVLYVPQGGVYKLLPVVSAIDIEHDDGENEDELKVDAGDEYEGLVNNTIQFEGEAQGGVEPYNWSWDFGDGNTSFMQNPTNVYNESGNYTAILTVTDDEGTVKSDSAVVEIKDE